MAHVVTAFLRNRGDLLLVRRSDDVGTYRGRWGGVSGSVEGDPAEALDDARREVREAVGVDEAALTLVRGGDPVGVDDEQGELTVHAFLFDCETRAVSLNDELDDSEWVPATAMLRRRTVPRLWDAYRAVSPTAETVEQDRTHGSATLSVRALEALRDDAACAESWSEVAETARALRDARPGMAVLRNRVNRVLSEADRTPDAVRERAEDAVAAAVEADDRAAAEAAALLDGPTLTLSRSGTVDAALRAADVPVFVAESVPGGEGREVAASLAAGEDGRDVTLLPDAAVAAVLAERDVAAVLVGADTVFPDGDVANKTGTRAAAVAAAHESVPVYVAAARDKISGAATHHPESAAFDVPDSVEGYAPLFDRTPADLVTVVTEDGELDAADVAATAATHRALAAWDDGSDDAEPDE